MRLELINDEIFMVINSLDFYSRIWIGQYDEIDSLLHLYGYNESDSLNFEDYEKEYLKLRSIMIPKLANDNFSCSLGIWNVETDNRAKSAYDMQQTIRYTQAWYKHPEGGIGTDFNTPILEGELPQIRCECQGDTMECSMILSGDKSNI